MQKVVYTLSELVFPIKTDDLQLTDFIFSLLQNSFLTIKKNSKNSLSDKDILFLASLDCLKKIYVSKIDNSRIDSSNDEKKEFKENFSQCNCSEQLQKIEYYIKSIIKSIDSRVF